MCLCTSCLSIPSLVSSWFLHCVAGSFQNGWLESHICFLFWPWQKRGRGKLLVVTWNSFLPSFLPFRKEGRKKRWKGRGNAANCEGTRQLSNNRTVAAGAGGTTKWGRSSDASYYFPPRSELRWGNKSELGLNAVYRFDFLPPARWEMRVKKILWMNSTATESRGRKMHVRTEME